MVSDGSIHVYGKLKGRALAGLGDGGDEGRIFATSFDPELVCVGGVFATGESEVVNGRVRGTSTMCFLDEEGELKFAPL